MDQTVLLERAGLLVRRCAEALRADAGDARWDETAQSLSRALAQHAEALFALKVFADDPQHPRNQQRLAGQLAAWAAADPSGRDALEALLLRWQPPPAPERPSGNSQTFAGDARIGVNVAGDLSGGLTVGPLDVGQHMHVDTGGGDYAGRDLDKSQRVVINGGTFSGPLFGASERPARDRPDAGRAGVPLADVLLVTVTDVETRAVFDALKGQAGHSPAQRFLGDKTYYDLGDVGGARVWLVRSEMGAVVPGGAFATVYGAIGALRPAAIVMVGIAFGTDPAGQQIGDILVAKQIQLYEPQRVGSGPDGAPRIVPRGDRASASPRLLDRCRDGALHWPAAAAQVRFGLVLSGEKLLDHRASVAELLAREPEALGGEMEGAGLYVAAAQHKLDWILIKAVCDWADGDKAHDKAVRQALAARNAAEFTLATLGRGGFGR